MTYEEIQLTRRQRRLDTAWAVAHLLAGAGILAFFQWVGI